MKLGVIDSNAASRIEQRKEKPMETAAKMISRVTVRSSFQKPLLGSGRDNQAV